MFAVAPKPLFEDFNGPVEARNRKGRLGVSKCVAKRSSDSTNMLVRMHGWSLMSVNLS